MANKRKVLKLLNDTISELKKVPCTFKFCDGDYTKINDMVTCNVCSSIHNLIEIKNNIKG